MAEYTTERILAIRHWSPRLFSLTTTRSPGFRFESGQFVMIGLMDGERRIVRAYSLASAAHEEALEFYSIRVADGPLTSRLARAEPGAPLLVGGKPTGTLVLRDLRPGRRLFLVATGTGVAPFAGLLRDPEVYERFAQVILVRGGRTNPDLAYGDATLAALLAHPDLGPLASAQLTDYPSLTREPHAHPGRVTARLATDAVTRDLGLPALDPGADRVMVCGSLAMVADTAAILAARGFAPSPGIGEPGDFVVERAFVDARAALPRTAAA
jgi:ferredoxin--NADP+ reductase